MEPGRERGKNKERGREETEIEEVDRDKCNLIEDDWMFETIFKESRKELEDLERIVSLIFYCW